MRYSGRLRATLLTVLVFASAASSPAQDTGDEPPKIGLVLSGGSARGLAHVGVLKVLDEARIPIDVVSGTSMGAVVGGLYALGYSPERIEQVALSQDWDRLFSDRIPRRSALLERRLAGQGIIVSVPFKGTEIRLPSGLLSGQQVTTALGRLTWGFQDVDDLATLPTPFTAVATHLRSGEAVALTDKPIALAIRASMSLPSVFTPVNIDGELYVDGGVARNIPAEDALDLGADVLIGVDVGAALDSASIANLSFLDVLVETAFFQSARSDEAQRRLLDVLIRPDVDGLSRVSFDDAEEWIRRGEEAARRSLPALRRLVDSLGLAPATPEYLYPTRLDPVFVREITVRGVQASAIRLVHSRLRLEEQTWLGPDDIDAAIGRVYGTGLFEEVTYRIRYVDSRGRPVPQYAGAMLDIRVVPRDAPNRIGFGFRYDSKYKAALLLDATLWGMGHTNSQTTLRARFGEQLQLAAAHGARFGRRSRFLVSTRGTFTQAPFDLYAPGEYPTLLETDPDVPVFRLNFSATRVDVFAGYASWESIRTGLMARIGHLRISERVAGSFRDSVIVDRGFEVASEDQSFAAGGAFLQLDTFDAVDFPTRGVSMTATGEAGISDALPLVSLVARRKTDSFDYGTYLAAIARIDWFIPLSRSVSLLGRAAATYGSGLRLPSIHYMFLGGRETVSVFGDNFQPQYGLRSQERFGRKSWAGLAGVQWEFAPSFFLRVVANAGDTANAFASRDEKVIGRQLFEASAADTDYGLGLELGLRTRGGPLVVALAVGERDQPLNVGFRFGFGF